MLESHTLTVDAEALLPDLVELRRAIHAEPEIGLHNPKTTTVEGEILLEGGLVTNAVRYAPGTIGLRLVLEGGLVCEVLDNSAALPRLRQANGEDENGRLVMQHTAEEAAQAPGATGSLGSPAVGEATDRTLPRPPANGVMGFVVSSLAPTVVPGTDACPNGTVPRLRDAWLGHEPVAPAAH